MESWILKKYREQFNSEANRFTVEKYRKKSY